LYNEAYRGNGFGSIASSYVRKDFCMGTLSAKRKAAPSREVERFALKVSLEVVAFLLTTIGLWGRSYSWWWACVEVLVPKDTNSKLSPTQKRGSKQI